jgi:hypothetical protein
LVGELIIDFMIVGTGMMKQNVGRCMTKNKQLTEYLKEINKFFNEHKVK